HLSTHPSIHPFPVSCFLQCFSPNAALHTKDTFHPQVRAVCQVQKAGSLSFNVAKVIVVGDVAVGKTCLISRFCKESFERKYKATIGVDFEMERFEVLGVPFSLQLWDTAGQERFKCIASTYYRGAQAIIVVFDLSSVSSLTHASINRKGSGYPYGCRINIPTFYPYAAPLIGLFRSRD
uniref:Ras-related protein Rab-34-like n=1 Tax=Gouania willdenowi TaxID=441366 RepID=A0A8C5DI20_GOUWI